MNDLLFDVPETLSPRLAWMQKHQIRTHHQPEMVDDLDPWTAWLPRHDWDENTPTCFALEHEGQVGYGQTEDAAIINLCVKENIRLWNEPPLSGTGVPSETPAVARVMPATESPTPAGVYDSLAAAEGKSPTP